MRWLRKVSPFSQLMSLSASMESDDSVHRSGVASSSCEIWSWNGPLVKGHVKTAPQRSGGLRQGKGPRCARALCAVRPHEVGDAPSIRLQGQALGSAPTDYHVPARCGGSIE